MPRNLRTRQAFTNVGLTNSLTPYSEDHYSYTALTAFLGPLEPLLLDEGHGRAGVERAGVQRAAHDGHMTRVT